MIMAWVVIQTRDDALAPLQLGWSTIVEGDVEQPAETEPPVESISIPSVSINQGSTASSASQTRTDDQDASETADDQTTPKVHLANVSNSLGLRTRQTDANVPGVGATDGTGREAIAQALLWIVNQQESDGRWRLDGDYADAGTIRTDTGATALALLALLGDGQTHLEGEHRESVRQGLAWLQQVQRENGDFFDIPEEGQEAHFYAHAQATIAFCEALALTGDDSLRPAAERAVHFLETAQNPTLGGWKYRPLNADGIGDLSVTGWALMALHSARMANIDVRYETFLVADLFLNSVQEHPSNAAYYKYRPDFPVAESQRLSMTAEGLLCRQWLGWPKRHLPLRRGIEFLTAERNMPEWKDHRRNVYAWYYTAQTLHNSGGKPWEEWFAHTLPLIVKAQQRGGRNRGSWHPHQPRGNPQERSRDAGRLYVTVMCVLILETPYRHAPLYEE